MHQSDKKIYAANEKDVSDESLNRNKNNLRKKYFAQKALDKERRNIFARELWESRALSSNIRQKNKARLYELWCECSFSWDRAKRVLRLEMVKSSNYYISDELLDQYQGEIQREFPQVHFFAAHERAQVHRDGNLGNIRHEPVLKGGGIFNLQIADVNLRLRHSQVQAADMKRQTRHHAADGLGRCLDDEIHGERDHKKSDE